MLLLFHGSNFRPTPTADVEYGLPRWHFPFLNGGKTCLQGRRRQPQKLTREAESELKKMMYKYEKESEEKNNIKKKMVPFGRIIILSSHACIEKTAHVSFHAAYVYSFLSLCHQLWKFPSFPSVITFTSTFSVFVLFWFFVLIFYFYVRIFLIKNG